MPADRYDGNPEGYNWLVPHRHLHYPWDNNEASAPPSSGGFSISSFLGLMIGFVVTAIVMVVFLLGWELVKWIGKALRSRKGFSFYFSVAFLIIVGSLIATPAFAEINENNLIDQIINQYRNNVAQWAGPIMNAATWMFWSLALIEFTWTGALLALRGADYAEVITEFIVRVMFIGFFAALLAFGPGWAQAIIWSLSDVASQASVAAGGQANTGAGTVFDTGLELAGRMVDDVSFWDSGIEALGIWAGSLIVIVCFALMTAMLILTMVETYIVVQAAVILLGFGPTRWTKDYALRYLTYAGATGMKWFVLLLIVGLGEALMLQWLNQYENNDTQVLLIIGASVVLLALVRNLPDLMQSILTGVSFSTGQQAAAAAQQTLNSTRMAGAAGARIATAAAGMGSAGIAATQLSRAQGNTGVGIVSGAVKNLASGMASEVGDKVTKGRYAGPASGAGHRMSDNMKKKIAALRSEGSVSKGS